MQVSQILLSDAQQELSPFLQHTTSTVNDAFPDLEHVLYDNESLRQFIADNYDKNVLNAYDMLRPYAYKADLGRYCVVNKLGGWYFDAAIKMHTPVQLGPRIKMMAFRDIQRFSGTGWSCANGVFYSQPDNPVLSASIETIVRHCREQYYGITPLCPTGPALFGQMLAANRGQPDFVYGDYLELTPVHEQKNRAFVLPNGTILAWGKPSGGGDIASLGAVGTNNYNELWHSREIYNTH